MFRGIRQRLWKLIEPTVDRLAVHLARTEENKRAEWRDQLGDTLEWVYGPALVSLLMTLLLAYTDAAHEVLLQLAMDVLETARRLAGLLPFVEFDASRYVDLPYRAPLAAVRGLSGLMAFLVFTLAVWQASRLAVLNSPRGRKVQRLAAYYRDKGTAPPEALILPKHITWTPRILAALPALGAAIGCMAAATSDESQGWEIAVLAIFAMMAINLAVYFLSLMVLPGDTRRRSEARAMAIGFTIFFLLLTIIAFWLQDFERETADREAAIRAAGLTFYLLSALVAYLYTSVAHIEDDAAYPWPDNLLLRVLHLPAYLWSRFSARNWMTVCMLIGAAGVIPAFIPASVLELMAFTGITADGVLRNVGFVFSMFLVLSLIFSVRGSKPDPLPVEPVLSDNRIAATFWILVVVLVPVLIAAVLIWPVDVPMWGGPLTVFSAFGAIAATVTAALTILSYEYCKGVPLNLILVLVAALASYFDLSDNHRIYGVERQVAVDIYGKTDPRRDVANAYRAWAAAETRALEPEETIYVVAAEGGGLFAAYHTAFRLAVLAGEDPDFRRRIFAISGVSGGSVGAGMYAAIEHAGLCGDNDDGACRCNAVRRVLKRDFLSPVAAAMLFPDSAASFIPGSHTKPLSVTDRARALDRAFATGVERWIADRDTSGDIANPLYLSLADAWDPAGNVPALFLNATDTHDGERRVLSGLGSMGCGSMGLGSGPGCVQTRVTLTNGNGVSILEAMSLSARFPLVSPAGRLSIEGLTEDIRLVDGGYFDNSGIETARDIIRDIKLVEPSRRVELLVIRLDDPGHDPRSYSFGEVTSPVSTFVGAWRARGGLTQNRMTQHFRSYAIPRPRAHARILNNEDFAFTLSWLLTDRTFNAIEEQVAGPDACAAPGASGG